jgi:glycosyltransferase involved in cell wall biosynthesis
VAVADRRIQVCIVYPADPAGVIPGGVDTFIRGIILWAPEDIEIRVVGVTTNDSERPVAKWTWCKLAWGGFWFYPILSLRVAGKQSVLPLSLRFTGALFLKRPQLEADILEFHRLEPSLAFFRDRRPKTVFIHQNMAVIRDAQTDIRWRYLPAAYFAMERFLLPRFQRTYCVRDDAVQEYIRRFEALSERFHFVPTWVDETVFKLPTEHQRTVARQQLARAYGFSEEDLIIASVGRLDMQKAPLLLLAAFRKIIQSIPRIRLIYVGEGVLRARLEQAVKSQKLSGHVILAGLRAPSDVADFLRAADLFVLVSAYEGMPMSVLEALACGTPVVTTAVGEVKRVVRPGVNGEIVSSRDPETISAAMSRCLSRVSIYRGEPCVRAVEKYKPAKVLAPVYENYRRLVRNASATL